MALQISDKNRCIFVHIPKAAGSSIEQSHLFDDQREKTGEYVGGHATAEEFRLHDPGKFEEYYKFTFVRNPYARLLSAYIYCHKGGANPEGKRIKETYFEGTPLDFHAFCLEQLSPEMIEDVVHLRPQWHFLCDENGELRVDFVGRVESFKADSKKVFKQLKQSFEYRHSLKGRNKHFSTYYTDEIAEVVYEFYKRDFELLSYDRKIDYSAGDNSKRKRILEAATHSPFIIAHKLKIKAKRLGKR